MKTLITGSIMNNAGLQFLVAFIFIIIGCSEVEQSDLETNVSCPDNQSTKHLHEQFALDDSLNLGIILIVESWNSFGFIGSDSIEDEIHDLSGGYWLFSSNEGLLFKNLQNVPCEDYWDEALGRMIQLSREVGLTISQEELLRYEANPELGIISLRMKNRQHFMGRFWNLADEILYKEMIESGLITNNR